MAWCLGYCQLDHQEQTSMTFDQNTKLFIRENASQNIVCEKAAILSTGRWVEMTLWLMGVIQANHYNDVIMGAIASQITSLAIVYSTVYSDADQRKHQSSASLAFVRGIHLGPVNSPHKWPVTRKMFPFDDVIMISTIQSFCTEHGSITTVLCVFN